MSVAAISFAGQTWKITKIESTTQFAGRLGRLVSMTLTVSADGKEKTVVVTPFHTTCQHKKSLKVGDSVEFKTNSDKNVDRADIRTR